MVEEIWKDTALLKKKLMDLQTKLSENNKKRVLKLKYLKTKYSTDGIKKYKFISVS